MDIKKYKVLLINIGCIVAFLCIAFIIFTHWVDSYTMHGETVQVPSLEGLTVEEAEIVAQSQGFLVKVSDTLSSSEVAPGAVIDHFPTKDSKVKRGRTIYLSVNSLTPLMVAMPKITDVSLRQATIILENSGLQVGQLEYKPDFADNYVFEQRYKMQKIEPGTKIPKGSAIDLLVGKGNVGEIIPVPAMVGLSWQTIKDEIMNGLNANLIFSEEVKTAADTARTVVVRQSPKYEAEAKMKSGDQLDLWLGFSSDPVFNAISEDLQNNN